MVTRSSPFKTEEVPTNQTLGKRYTSYINLIYVYICTLLHDACTEAVLYEHVSYCILNTGLLYNGLLANAYILNFGKHTAQP